MQRDLPRSTFLKVRHIGPDVERNPWAGEPDWPSRRLSWQDHTAPGQLAASRSRELQDLRAALAAASAEEADSTGKPQALLPEAQAPERPEAGQRRQPKRTARAPQEPPHEGTGWAFMDQPLQRVSDLPPGLQVITVRSLLRRERQTLPELMRWFHPDPEVWSPDVADLRRASIIKAEGVEEVGCIAFLMWLGADRPSAHEYVTQAHALALEHAGRYLPAHDFVSWYAEILLRVYRASVPIPGKRRKPRPPAEVVVRRWRPGAQAAPCPDLTRILLSQRDAGPANGSDGDPMQSTDAIRACIRRQARPSWPEGGPPEFAELVTAAKDGNHRAWAEMFYQWDGEGWRMARSQAPATWAEDALQEAWTKLLDGGLKKYDPAMPFGPWFLQVVKNTARNHGRTERRKLEQLERCALAYPDEHEWAEHACRDLQEAAEDERAQRAIEESWPWWALA